MHSSLLLVSLFLIPQVVVEERDLQRYPLPSLHTGDSPLVWEAALWLLMAEGMGA